MTTLDEVCEAAHAARAFRGKLTEAGGFLLLFALPECHKAVRELEDVLHD